MKAKIKIAIVDDSNSYREFSVLALKKYEELDIIINCSNGMELIEGILIEKPDAVLLDVTMPIMDGIKTTEYLSKHFPEIKILILTAHNNEDLLNELLKKGANVYLLKDNGFEQVADAIYTLFKYEHYFTNSSLEKTNYIENESKIFDANDATNHTVIQDEITLNDKEKKLLIHICEGLSNKEIADKLSLSLRTIENKRAKMFKKTKTNNIAKLIRFAQQNKII